MKREELEIVPDYGERIKRAREERGLSREALARLVGIKVSTLRSIENQDIPLDLETAAKLEEILGVKLIQEASEAAEKAESGDVSISGADIMAFRAKLEELRKRGDKRGQRA